MLVGAWWTPEMSGTGWWVSFGPGSGPICLVFVEWPSFRGRRPTSMHFGVRENARFTPLCPFMSSHYCKHLRVGYSSQEV